MIPINTASGPRPLESFVHRRSGRYAALDARRHHPAKPCRGAEFGSGGRGPTAAAAPVRRLHARDGPARIARIVMERRCRVGAHSRFQACDVPELDISRISQEAGPRGRLTARTSKPGRSSKRSNPGSPNPFRAFGGFARATAIRKLFNSTRQAVGMGATDRRR